MCIGSAFSTLPPLNTAGDPVTLDADLAQAYGSTITPAQASLKSPLMPALAIAAARQPQIIAEQENRDALRMEYAAAEQAANDQLAQIGQQQAQAEEARAAEAERQQQLQSQIDRARAAQAAQIRKEQAATSAITSSAMAPGMAGAAPAAQMSRGRRGRGRARTAGPGPGLRIDGARQTSGVGLNIGV